MLMAISMTPGENDSSRAQRYHRAHRWLSVAGFVLDLAYLLVLLLTGWSRGLRALAESEAARPAVALLIYLLLFGLIHEALDLPLSYVQGYWLEHRYSLSNLALGGWAKDRLKGLAVGGVLATLGFEFVYWTMRRWPARWWEICAAAFIAFFILLANLAPVLLLPIFFKFKPVEDAALTDRLMELSRRAGKRVRGVYEWKLSEKSKKANAALTGLGNTRRIIISDTLLQNFSPPEVEAVLAHEFGHHVRHHIVRGLAIEIATTLMGFYAVNAALGAWEPKLGFRGLADFANLPLLLLVTGALSFVLLPLVNVHSRQMEREADAYALHSIASPEAFISSMEKLAAINLSERHPAAWIEFLFHSHPSVEKRIAFARNLARLE
jgi:STE24 endopeptidase